MTLGSWRGSIFVMMLVSFSYVIFHNVSFFQTCPMKGRSDDTFHEQFSERFMDHVRQVCTFAKLIPGFKCLHHDDQVTLLKSCVFEVLLVRLAGLFDNQVRYWITYNIHYNQINIISSKIIQKNQNRLFSFLCRLLFV